MPDGHLADADVTDADGAADALYALAPRDFTAERDQRARSAKAAGDKDAARQIAALRKPTVTAWLANQLVRRRRDELASLLELGAGLREATAALSGPQLRELSRQRNKVVQELVRQARRLAAADGQPVSEDVARGLESTLNAALADEAAAETLLRGRLTVALEHSGFGLPVTTGSKAASKDAPKDAASPGMSQERRLAAEAELAAAVAVARSAADVRLKAVDRDRRLGAATAEAGDQVTRLRGALAEAEKALARLEGEQQEAAHAVADATAASDRADAAVTRLQRRLEEP